MKFGMFFLFLLNLFMMNCNYSYKTPEKLIKPNTIFTYDSTISTPIDSERIDHILKVQKEKRSLPLSYEAKQTDSLSWQKYTLNKLGLSFLNLNSRAFTFRKLYLNSKLIKRIPYKDFRGINIDSMDLIIDYTESTFYSFKEDSSYLLVISFPMNWVGNMTNYSFFQLINLNEYWVVEFVRKSE